MNRIVVCPEPLAAAAGAEIFRDGGSAVDAALATAYAQAVVSPAMTTLAATGVMNLYHAPSRRNVLIDFLDRAGSLARPDMYPGVRPGEILFGYPSILVPTFVRGTQTAFEQFGSGRVSWGRLLEPAIRYAEEGFSVYPYLHQYWRAEAPVLQTSAPFDGFSMLSTTPACAAIFTGEGRVLGIGERLVQPDLARTLRRLAVEGPEEFYTGETGRRLAADLERHGAPVTARDLALCRAEIREPLRGSYRGLAISTDPPPAIGGLLLLLLNILEGYDLRALGQESAAYYDLLARALFLVFGDRTRLAEAGADPARTAHFTSKAHAAELRSRIGEVPRRAAQAPADLPGTTHVTTYDDEGSAVSLTHTVCYGSGVVTPGLGFMYNNGMCMFDPRPGLPNSIAPGKRPIAGGGPAILFHGDLVRLVLGSPHGGRKTSSMAHVLTSLLDFGLSAAAAVASPRIHCEHGPRELRVDPFFPLDTRGALGRLGYQVREDFYGGRVCLVAVDPDTRKASGASDPRGGGGLMEL
ncbi:MAG TPA: gamma-glutamyltransferase [Candidatus Methylomirabilis sp.]|nr:gamma-glutamyltransferase [Candidatus Methylomirabilis sp.]